MLCFHCCSYYYKDFTTIINVNVIKADMGESLVESCGCLCLDDNFQNFGTNVSTVLLGDLMFMLVMS